MQLDDIQKSIIILALDNLLSSSEVILEEIKELPDATESIEYLSFLKSSIPLIIQEVGSDLSENKTQGIPWQHLQKGSKNNSIG